MTDEARPRGHSTDERAELEGILDWFRTIVARKLDGLDRADATRIATPTGTTILSLVKHLAWVERNWFERHLVGGPTPTPATQPDLFTVADHDTVESVLAAYGAACEASRRCAATVDDLDTVGVEPHWFFERFTLRWLYVHMIQETARHAGHLDLLRELTDGRTGD